MSLMIQWRILYTFTRIEHCHFKHFLISERQTTIITLTCISYLSTGTKLVTKWLLFFYMLAASSLLGFLLSRAQGKMLACILP